MKKTGMTPTFRHGTAINATPALRRGISMALNAARESGAPIQILRQIETLDLVVNRGTFMNCLRVVRT